MPGPENILASGKPVVDIVATARPDRIPGSIRRQLTAPKIVTTTSHIQALMGELAHAEIPIKTSEGGGALNMAARMAPLTEKPVRMRTWVGNDEPGHRIINDLEKRRKDGLDPDIIILSNADTPIGLVIPRLVDGKKDRTIFSNTSEGMQSDFSDAIDKPMHFAIVNSHGGPDWPANLSKGTQKLKDLEIPYVYTPGSSQIEAVRSNSSKDREKRNAVYDAIDGAHILSVDVKELRDLLHGKNLLVTETTSVAKLLTLGKQHLGASVIFATDGPNGANAIDVDGSMWHVEMAEDSGVKSTVGAGDAFNAAAALKYFEDDGRDIRESLVWGSVNGAIAVESYGAHENCVTRDQLEQRVNETRPAVTPIPIAA